MVRINDRSRATIKRAYKCYDLRDIWRTIPKRERVVTESQFGDIMRMYFLKMQDFILDYQEVVLPYGFGTIKAVKVVLEDYVDAKTGKVHISLPNVNKLYTIQLRKNDPIAKANKEIVRFTANEYMKVFFYRGNRVYNRFRYCRLYPSRTLSRRLINMSYNGKLQSKFTKYI